MNNRTIRIRTNGGIMKKILITGVVSALLLTGIPAGTPAFADASPSALIESAKKSDEAAARSLFQAIWFATGDQVPKLSENVRSQSFRTYLNEHASQETDIRQMANDVAERLEKSQPGYLATLYKNLTSGDVYKVESSLAATSTDVLQTVREKYPVEVASVSNDGGASGNCLWVFAVAAVAVWSGAVVVNYAGVVNVAGAVNAVGWFNASVPVNVRSSSSLETVAATDEHRAVTEDTVAALTVAFAK
ncbi:hypothetical protein [Arthrobacter sp. MMS24-S77]